MDTGDWQHLEIKCNTPGDWQLVDDRTNVLLVALNMPGYYSLPVRILSLLASTRKEIRSRFNVRFVEGSIIDPTDRISGIVQGMRPDIIGFSVNIWNQQLVIRLAEQIRSAFPDVVLLAGGQEVTNSVLNPLQALPNFDFIVDGEGELPFSQFLEEWNPQTKSLTNQENVSGLHYYTGDGIPAFSGPAEIVPELDEVPSVILAGLIDPKLCKKKLGVMIEGARGCPFKCGYCFEGGYNRKVRTTSMERLIAEMDYMVDRGAGYFHLMDPILCNSNPERLKSISKYFTTLKKIRKGAIILVEAYAQHITEEIASHLKQGFIVDIGLQTINKPTNDAITRPFNQQKFSEGITYLHNTGASFNIYLICGLPYETMETFFRGIIFALQQSPTKIFFNELQLLNGTALRREAVELGYDFNPVPQYEVHATRWMSNRAMQITLTAARMLGRYYNLNGRSIFAAAPWYSSPHGGSHTEVTIPLASPCSIGCNGCRQGLEDSSNPEIWLDHEKKQGTLAGRDVCLVVGDGIDEKQLLKFSGRMPLASVLRTKICAAPDFLESPQRIDRLFQAGVWHYSTFLTAPASCNVHDRQQFEKDLGRLQSLNRTIPLPGAAVLEPHLEIKLLPGEAGPEDYLFAIEKIISRRPTVITIPVHLDNVDHDWQSVLNKGFDICTSQGHWLRLPEKLMGQALGEENSEQIISYLKQMNLISTDDSKPVCYRD